MLKLNELCVAAGAVILLQIAAPIVTEAQIPNAGFETWGSGNPADWATSNAPPAIVNVTQTADHHSGASAAQGAVVSVAGFPIPPALVSGSSDNGFPINFRPAALHGFYKFTSVGGDSFIVSLGLARLGAETGGGTFRVSATTSQWREFVANITYQTGDIPDTVVIGMAIPLPGHIGSTFEVDDLAFGPATDVTLPAFDHPTSFELHQNYPNPLNPATTITYQLPEQSHVTLKVYDVLGRGVATLADGLEGPGYRSVRFDASNLASGVYIYELQAGNFVASKRLLLLK